MNQSARKDDRGPGVPEAVARCLQRVGVELGAAALDRVWVFPPLVSGRSESGLLAVSHYPVETDDPDQRLLSILAYTAERSGKGLTLEGELLEQGEAPLDRFPRVMEGVVARTDLDLGEPSEIEIDGDEEAFLAVLADFPPEYLDPDLPPVAEAVVEDPDEGEAEGAGREGGTKSPAPRQESLADVLLDDGSSPDEGMEPAPPDPTDELFDLYTPGGSS